MRKPIYLSILTIVLLFLFASTSLAVPVIYTGTANFDSSVVSLGTNTNAQVQMNLTAEEPYDLFVGSQTIYSGIPSGTSLALSGTAYDGTYTTFGLAEVFNNNLDSVTENDSIRFTFLLNIGSDQFEFIWAVTEPYDFFGVPSTTPTPLVADLGTIPVFNGQVTNTGTSGGRTDLGNVIITASTVPEPTTMLLFGAGLVGLAGFGRKKFKK